MSPWVLKARWLLVHLWCYTHVASMRWVVLPKVGLMYIDEKEHGAMLNSKTFPRNKPEYLGMEWLVYAQFILSSTQLAWSSISSPRVPRGVQTSWDSYWEQVLWESSRLPLCNRNHGNTENALIANLRDNVQIEIGLWCIINVIVFSI